MILNAKKISTFFLALAVFGLTLFLQSRSANNLILAQEPQQEVNVLLDAKGASLLRDGQIQQLKENFKLIPGDELQTNQDQTVTVNFSTDGVIRLGAGTKLQFESGTAVASGFVFILQSGTVWVNSSFSTDNLKIIAPGVLLEPRRAVFNLENTNGKSVLKVYSNAVEAGLIPENYKNGPFINSFLVPAGNLASFYKDKIYSSADDLKRLFYSKLIKEFEYSLIDPQEWISDTWFAQNLKLDQQLQQAEAKKVLTGIRESGLKVSSLDDLSYQFKKATDRVANFMTFRKEKNLQRLVETVFDQINDAEYLLIYGRNSEAKERLVFFKSLLEENISLADSQLSDLLMKNLRQVYYQLISVLPDDPLFEAKATATDLLLKYLGKNKDEVTEKIYLLSDYFGYANQLAGTNQTLARSALEQYYSRFNDLFKADQKIIAQNIYLISEQNLLMDNLLLQYPQFYQDVYFAMKHSLEVQWLALLPDGTVKDDQKQTIISNKIDFLKKLRDFVLAESVNINDAKMVVTRLINEIKDLQTNQELGISQLFDLRLKDYGQFLRFLKSTTVDSLKGTSISDKYQQFVADQAQQAVTFDQALSEFLDSQNGGSANLTVAKVLEQIKKDFSDAKVLNLELGDLKDLSQKSVDVKNGELNGNIFKATYDWNSKLISQILVGDKIVMEDGIKLENLGKVLLSPGDQTLTQQTVQNTQQTMDTQQTQSTGQSEQVVGDSKADRIAKILLTQKLKTMEIAVKEVNIQMVDKEVGIFTITEAALISDSSVVFSFTLHNKENLVESIIVKSDKGDKSLDGQFILSDLSSKVAEVFKTIQ